MITRRHQQTVLLFLVIFLANLAPLRAEQPDKGNRRSPRATVQALYTSVSASRLNPRQREEAVACLDVEGLPGGRADHDRLAVQLEAVLRAEEVNSEQLPETVDGDTYVFPGRENCRITMRRTPEGRWLFDRDTVTRIPKMWAEARKVLEERNKQAATLNVAPEVASPRATFRTFLGACGRGDTDRALRCLNLTDIPAAARSEIGESLANKLCQVILRHRPLVYQDIPDSNYSDAFVWLALPEGSIELMRLPSGERKGEWVFTRQTLRSVDALYRRTEGQAYAEGPSAVNTARFRINAWRTPELWLHAQLPGWATANLTPVAPFRVETYQLVGLLLLVGLAFVVNRVSVRLLTWSASRGLRFAGLSLDADTTPPRLRPAGRLLTCLLFRAGLLLLDPDKLLLGYGLSVLNPLAWVLGLWAVYRVMDLIGDVSQARMADSKRRVEITEMLWPVGSLATKIGLAVGMVLHLMSLFSWDVTAVLTGLGIGGVAFALGAQDSLRNLFGSFTLLADRPFVVGETVRIGNDGLGVVERVGLRSTSIRTVDDTVIVVPNSNLTTMNITNFGRRRFRRFTTLLAIVYGTPPKELAQFCAALRSLITEQKGTRKEQFEVAINGLGASAIEVEVSVYFDVTTRREEVEAREALLLGCLRLADELQIELAFPMQTKHPAKEEPPSVILNALRESA